MNDISHPSFNRSVGLLEVAVFNIHSALLAAQNGADRIELCENPLEGGTTPSFGALKTAKEKINVPVFPIIRPRGGDFLYTDDEFEVMRKDILLVKELGFEGVVIGILKTDGTVDAERTKKLVELSYPLEVTFHRAYDRTKEPFQALEDIIACGCQRILTSGQTRNAYDGKKLIRQLVEKADDRIIIMPGSGVRSSNIAQLADFTNASEFHSSARKMVGSGMQYHQISMHESKENISVDINEIMMMKRVLQTKE